ncbi:MAG: conserved membrane protein of unknown function [Candidatus Thorarchaeota archaeon]|nr:MAG: conserved membrane protein of unknown function [Candidatus Thorarchaeota archaeon]
MSEQEKPEERIDELEFEKAEWTRTDDLKESIHMFISHHPPSLFGHCLRVRVLGRSIYFCGRCTGIYGGLAIGIVTLALLDFSLTPDWFWFLVSLVFGHATVVDWMSQRLTPRKTTNLVRASTGFLSGLGLAIVFLLANLFFMLTALAVMTASIGIVSILEAQINKKSQSTETKNLETKPAE